MDVMVLLATAAMMIIVCLMLFSVRLNLVPPGPRLLPVIGNLHLVYNRDIRVLIQRLRQTYGDIYSLYIGRRLVVIINGKRLLKEVFVKNAGNFSNRPTILGGGRLKIDKGILNSYGPSWHQQRQFVSSVFRDLDPSVSDLLESNIALEMIQLTSTLIELSQMPFDPSRFLQVATSNVLFSMLLGVRFETDDPQVLTFHKSLQNVMPHPTFNSFIDSQTSFDWLPGLSFHRKKQLEIQEAELMELICRHLKTRLDACNEEDDGVGVGVGLEGNAFCFADVYIRKIRQDDLHGIDSSFNVENLIQIILELLSAGTEPTAVVIEWILLYLALNPQCQERARNEIDLVLDGAFPCFSDRQRLPYLEAVILESQRLADITPFSMLHESATDAVVEGLSIPSKSILVANMTSVLHDPKLFTRPHEFSPERFLSGRGNYLKKAIFSSFFIGKRSCLGENLAKMEIFLFITALLQHFWFALPEDSPPPSLQGKLGAVRRPLPFKIIAIQRQF